MFARNTKSKFNIKHIEQAPSGPSFIAEWDYQVDSCGLGSLSHPSPSSALSFEQIFKRNGHGNKNDNLGIAPTTFTCFGNLPTELRLIIWGMVCEQQRNVNIEFQPLFNRDTTPSGYVYLGHAYVSNTPAPSVLYVGKESREEALNHYSLCFGVNSDSDRFHSEYQLNMSWFKRPRIEAQPTIWCNFKADTICSNIDFNYQDGQRYQEIFMKCATTGMRSLAFNIFSLLTEDLDPVEINWTDIFLIIQAYGARRSELQEIVLYYDDKQEAEAQPMVSEFVELDWSAMDPCCNKMKELQNVQKDLLRDFPSWWPMRGFGLTTGDERVWKDIQSKVKLMDIKVNYQ